MHRLKLCGHNIAAPEIEQRIEQTIKFERKDRMDYGRFIGLHYQW